MGIVFCFCTVLFFCVSMTTTCIILNKKKTTFGVSVPLNLYRFFSKSRESYTYTVCAGELYGQGDIIYGASHNDQSDNKVKFVNFLISEKRHSSIQSLAERRTKPLNQTFLERLRAWEAQCAKVTTRATGTRPSGHYCASHALKVFQKMTDLGVFNDTRQVSNWNHISILLTYLLASLVISRQVFYENIICI